MGRFSYYHETRYRLPEYHFKLLFRISAANSTTRSLGLFEVLDFNIERYGLFQQ